MDGASGLLAVIIVYRELRRSDDSTPIMRAVAAVTIVFASIAFEIVAFIVLLWLSNRSAR
jgi:hypothetical protein